MAIRLGGLASGIDTEAMVDSLVKIARIPADQAAARKARVSSATQTLSTFSSKLSSLKTAALALSTSTNFASFTSTSSDTAVVASATGSAVAGSYAVHVTALARAQKSRSDVQASITDPVGAGTLKFTIGSGSEVSVSIDGDDTLADVAAKLSSSGARVSASVLNTGGGYRLLVQGLDSGADNAITFTEEDGLALGLSAPANTYESAQDAALTIDGMSVTSKTNQVTGAIPGVTLALTKLTTSPATVQVSSDPAALQKKLEAFVSAYNDIVKVGHNAAGFGTQKASNAELAGDRAIRGSLTRLAKVMGDAVPGTSGKYTTLRSVGLALGRDGSLSLDAKKLSEAMNADPSSVARLFVTDKTTGATGMMKTMMSTVDSLVSGETSLIQGRIDGLASKTKSIDKSVARLEQQATAYGELLRNQFRAMDDVVGRYNSMSSAISALPRTTYEE